MPWLFDVFFEIIMIPILPAVALYNQFVGDLGVLDPWGILIKIGEFIFRVDQFIFGWTPGWNGIPWA